jgi:CIC family chloride channel protein
MRRKLSPASWLSRIPRSQTLWLGTIAVVVGLTTGIGVWLFKELIAGITLAVSQLIGAVGGNVRGLLILLVPVIGGLVVGLTAVRLIGREKLHGVASVIESVAVAGGRLRYATTPIKALVSGISIGVGAPLGPEDPSVQIGANLGSMFAQKLRMSEERVRLLVAAGSGAAIAAAFNAPIAGVFFALELILPEINANALGMMLVSSVASSAFIQAVSGPEPAFHVPAYAIHSGWELPLYLGLGLVAGPIAALYIRTLYAAQDLASKIRLPDWVKTVALGLVVGIAALVLPQILGTGYGTIQDILNTSDYGLSLLLALLLVRLLLTPASLAAGFSGGVFAPSLYLGAVLGGAYGLIASRLLPGLAINPPAFALVGMAAVLAGSVRAPLTATILLFEMTSDYRIILPLMLAVAVSVVLSERIEHDSIYLASLVRIGVRLNRGRDVEVLRSLSVGEVMQSEADAISETATLTEATERLAATRRHGLPVVNIQGDLIGMLTAQDIDKVSPPERDTVKAGDVCTRDLIVAYPHESLSDALLRMSHADVGRLPVVDRNYNRRLVGILRRVDVIRAYEIALVRRAADRHKAEEVRLDALTPDRVLVTDMIVQDHATLDGKQMRDIRWPDGALIASVRRANKVFIPHGGTVIQAGDTLVVVAEGKARQQVAEMCREPRDI